MLYINLLPPYKSFMENININPSMLGTFYANRLVKWKHCNFSIELKKRSYYQIQLISLNFCQIYSINFQLG